MIQAVTSDAELLERIDRFCSQHNIAPTAFGRAAIGDGNLIANLRNGRSVTLKTAQRALSFMAEYKPASPADAPSEAAA